MCLHWQKFVPNCGYCYAWTQPLGVFSSDIMTYACSPRNIRKCTVEHKFVCMQSRINFTAKANQGTTDHESKVKEVADVTTENKFPKMLFSTGKSRFQAITHATA